MTPPQTSRVVGGSCRDDHHRNNNPFFDLEMGEVLSATSEDSSLDSSATSTLCS